MVWTNSGIIVKIRDEMLKTFYDREAYSLRLKHIRKGVPITQEVRLKT